MTNTISNILVPTDFSRHAEHAWQYAITLAQRLSARLELVHVVEDPLVTGGWSPEVYLPNGGELLEGIVADVEQRLAVHKRAAAAVGVAAKGSILTGQPPAAILDYARTGGFDLIVMGTHGRTGLAHVLMGSVAERIVREAACPVLTLRAPADADGRSEPVA